MSIATPTAAGANGPAKTPLPTYLDALAYPLAVSLNDDGIARPFFRCSVCQRLIDNAHEANFIWNPNDLTPVIACRDECDADLRAKGFRHWIPLNVAILFLINNSKLDMSRSRREASDLASIAP